MSRLKPRKINYRSYKKFVKENFLYDLENNICNTSLSETDVDAMYNLLSDTVLKTLEKHAPMKQKYIRGNQARFMNKELSRAIMVRSHLKSIYNKNPCPENRLKYTKQRNKCVALRKKAIKGDFDKVTNQTSTSSKAFYDIVKPYITNKGGLGKNDMTLVEKDEIVSNESKLAEIFNKYYVNIVKITNIGNNMCPGTTFQDVVLNIIENYKVHPSIIAIKGNVKIDDKFYFSEVSEVYIGKLLSELDPKKSIGDDKIPPKIIKLAAHILKGPIKNIVNQSIRQMTFPSRLKSAAVAPFYKCDDKTDKKNYRPVSVLNSFSKIFEMVIKDQIVPYFDKYLSIFISAYRKRYSSQHVLIRLIEEWRDKLDQNLMVGAILMDLSKAFDCIPHDLLIAKLEAYGLDITSLTYIYSYLKGRKQSVRINNIYSIYLLILSGVPQGSILGPILFNVFMNDLFLFIKTADIHNFADDNTLSAFARELNDLLDILEIESKISIDWLESNDMIVDPTKFQSIIICKNKKIITRGISVTIKDKIIKSKEWVKLLGIKIDDNLNFNVHIGEICNKASGQLNAIFRLSKYLTSSNRKLLINSFIYCHFNYCPLVWHFMSCNSKNKIEKIQECAIRFLTNDSKSSYASILEKSGKVSMEVNRLRILCIEIFKTLKDINPQYMADIFKQSTNRSSLRFSYNIAVPKPNQVKYGERSLRSLAPKIWNNLPHDIKLSENLDVFKANIKTWGGVICNCAMCRKF